MTAVWLDNYETPATEAATYKQPAPDLHQYYAEGQCPHGGTEEICDTCGMCHDCEGTCPWVANEEWDELRADAARDDR